MNDKAVEKIAKLLYDWGNVRYFCEEKAEHLLNVILSDPDIPICEYEPDATLPEIPEFTKLLGYYDDEEYIPYLQRGAINYSKRLAGWVKRK